MKGKSLMIKNPWMMSEDTYKIENEPINAALMTTSNGYIGVRGSFEEYGSLRIQGCYIRGVIDEVYEIIEPFPDNEYMRKYYFDEDKLKNFEKQESIINFADILLVRITVGGETFFPWEGTVLSWERKLDMKNACLVREVRWQNSRGSITSFKFERFASFQDDHLYCIKVSVTPENHNEKIEIISGLDLRTKTAGQKITKKIMTEVAGNQLYYQNYSGDLYRFIYTTGVSNRFYSSHGEMEVVAEAIDDGSILANHISFDAVQGETYSVEKKIYVITSRDVDGDAHEIVKSKIKELEKVSYHQLFEEHQKDWNEFFKEIDVIITGDEEADTSLRFCNYHTAISIARNDSIHSIAAKALTGERYNNFVWWDCEVYQLPFFFLTHPEMAKNALIYRYGKLEAAREIAKSEGRRGARFPFISSVTGLEKVWEYVRHPFMQIHIVSDVAWGVIHYYICTGDRKFMERYGIEILWEVARYWAARIEYNILKSRYEIKTVTGTDEHHPYVDNDAYTNYLTCLVLKYAVKMYHEFEEETANIISKIMLQKQEIEEWKDIADKMYLPLEQDTGLIPQFDGYFQLDKGLETAGGSTAKQFQMKESGLYHKSQVIKQPDVMLLFSYINLNFNSDIYSKNWNYYEKACETSSSLSFPVHAICASDLNQPESAYQYFMKSARIDLDDIHHCAWQGIHSGCTAGAFYSLVRGIAGIICRSDRIEINPHPIPKWKEVKFNFVWHGQQISVMLTNVEIVLYSHSNNNQDIPIKSGDELHMLQKGKELYLNLAIDFSLQNAFKAFLD